MLVKVYCGVCKGNADGTEVDDRAFSGKLVIERCLLPRSVQTKAAATFSFLEGLKKMLSLTSTFSERAQNEFHRYDNWNILPTNCYERERGKRSLFY